MWEKSEILDQSVLGISKFCWILEKILMFGRRFATMGVLKINLGRWGMRVRMFMPRSALNFMFYQIFVTKYGRWNKAR